ncbi:hypothetical protein JKP88DRAFT_335230 [Tribonema minus]|uniref:Cytochrome b5 heme-binding domain-containing protein n=1 Tax=Tribonema minus TaxID=303371 RepID=A0A835YMT3_9STRA|nr:hypothetical protein JKP88DRAFT_335230 [Tribonema minus]
MLCQLPATLLVEVLSYLSPYHVTVLEQASSHTRDVARLEGHWRERFIRLFGHPHSSADVPLHAAPHRGSAAHCRWLGTWRLSFYRELRERPHTLMSEARAAGLQYLLIHGSVYDVGPFLDLHPGGVGILLEQVEKGGDATRQFELYMHSDAARRMMRDFCVWDAAAAAGAHGTLRTLLLSS